MNQEVLPSLEFTSAELSSDELERSSPQTRPIISPDSSFSSGINWAQVYSSDEESQKAGQRRLFERSTSDVSLADVSMISSEGTAWNSQLREPHRRPRGINHRRSIADTDESSQTEERTRSPRSSVPVVSLMLPSLARCTPLKWLVGLFLVSCYTTFWLPYPEIRPAVTQVPTASEYGSQLSEIHRIDSNNTIRAVGSSGAMLHARSTPEVELEFRPGLDRYFEQEGFSNHAWTMYANVGALGTVIAWAVREQHRRREDGVAAEHRC